MVTGTPPVNRPHNCSQKKYKPLFANSPSPYIFALRKFLKTNAEVAQLVEHHLAKVRVAGSSLVFRSNRIPNHSVWNFLFTLVWANLPEGALVAELVDAQDLKSCLPQGEYGFDSRLGHKKAILMNSLFSLIQAVHHHLLGKPTLRWKNRQFAECPFNYLHNLGQHNNFGFGLVINR